MASGRIVKTQISLSEQVNDLSVYSALLFTWMIPHTDDFGRMYGNARRVKAVVVPMRDDFTADTVMDCLDELISAQLIEIYKVKGDFYIQLPEFEAHQTGLHKRTKSKFPGKDEADEILEVPGSSGKFRPELEQEQELEQELEQEQERNNMSGKPDDTQAKPKPESNIPETLLTYLNEKAGRNYKPVDANLKLIRGRLAEGHTPDDIRDVITMKVEQWDETKWEQYLRPATLFNAEKFNQYAGNLNEWRESGGVDDLSWTGEDGNVFEGELDNG